MLANRRSALCFAFGMVFCATLATSGLAGKGGGKGGGGGGQEPTATLPEGLDVRYRVQFIPIPFSTYATVAEVNECYEAIGWYEVDGLDTGYYYNALTGVFLSAHDMIDLPAPFVGSRFEGINNHGVIVGSASDAIGRSSAILMYPEAEGYACIVLPPPVENPYKYRARSINDFGDVVGDYRLENTGTPDDAFAYNPGIDPFDPTDDVLAMMPFGLLTNSFVEITNTRRALVSDEFGTYWFDFVSAINGEPPLYNAEIPDGWDGIGISSRAVMSHDGQLAVVQRTEVRKNKFADTPAVVSDSEFLWIGDPGLGRPQAVNSIDESAEDPADWSPVGDLLGTAGSFKYWLQHADWGYLEIDSMLVFDSELDKQIWDSITTGALLDMSDRDPLTGFGLIVGKSGDVGDAIPFVLMPDFVSTP